MRRSIMGTNGAAIQRLRFERGLHGWQLAEKASIHQGYLSRIENGKRQGTAPVLRRIADALGVNVSDITTVGTAA